MKVNKDGIPVRKKCKFLQKDVSQVTGFWIFKTIEYYDRCQHPRTRNSLCGVRKVSEPYWCPRPGWGIEGYRALGEPLPLVEAYEDKYPLYKSGF